MAVAYLPRRATARNKIYFLLHWFFYLLYISPVVTCFVNAKGGVGKTTVATHYALWRAGQGAKVGLIDADKQRLSSRWVKRAEERGLKLHGLETWGIDQEQAMLDRIAAVKNHVDVLVVDGPAGDTRLTRVILLRSDLAFLPCGPSDLDLAGTRQEIRIIHDVQDIRGGPPRAWCVPNRLTPNQILTRELLALGAELGVPFTDRHLRQRPPYADAPGQGTVVWEMGAIRRAAGEEMMALCAEIYDKEKTIG